MSSDTLELLDANIVIIPEEPLAQTVNTSSLFEGGPLTPFMRKPLTMSQGLTLDVSLGTHVGTYQIESMRSQKVIILSSFRVEVHDRSGDRDFEKAQLPETIDALVNGLNIGRIKAIGVNWEITFDSLKKTPASTAIAERLLQQDMSFLPNNMSLIGGAVRLFLAEPPREYTLAIEPRGHNAQTNTLWMTCNASISYPEQFSIELLKDMFQQSHNLLFQVKESLFPAL